ncbi:MAG: helix-turn-helix domain-containing protein [Saccharofermentanales bacterium]|jgi:putative transcriptional regulator
MAVSYNKLWKLLIDKKMKKKDLQQIAGVSASFITKLGRDESVTTATLTKICNALNCDFGDIMEIVPDEHHLQ